MYRTFNMGLGFTLAVPPDAADAALAMLRRHYPGALRIGRAVADPLRRITIPAPGVVLE
jgi:phosphoribosylaminoimidazole (AIR) synthetase